MGYSTTFKGVLKFKAEPTVSVLRALKTWLGEDLRELAPEYAEKNQVNYIDLELTEDFAGLQWSGAEKTYGLVAAVNWIIDMMRDQVLADFTLTGELTAQGEDADDRWILRMVGGRAVEIKIPVTGEKMTCPECGHQWRLNEE